MTVLGRGDLSPPRHHRRRAPALLAVAGVAAVAAGGWFGWHTFHRSGHGTRAAVKVCVTPTAAPSPAAPAAVSLSVLNATKRVGLAHQVAAALRARGFRVVHVGNTTARVAAPVTISYPRGGERAARTVAEQVRGAVLVTSGNGAVTLVIGSSFGSLATAADVAAAHAHDVQAASPRPAVCSAS